VGAAVAEPVVKTAHKITRDRPPGLFIASPANARVVKQGLAFIEATSGV